MKKSKIPFDIGREREEEAAPLGEGIGVREGGEQKICGLHIELTEERMAKAVDGVCPERRE